MRTILALLALASVSFAAEPVSDAAFRTSFRGVKAAPPAEKLSKDRFVFLYLPNHAGALTLDVANDDAVKMFPVKPGEFPGFHQGDAEALMHKVPESKSEVWAVFSRPIQETKVVTITAWGIVDNRPAKIGIKVLTVEGSRPPPIPPDPKPPGPTPPDPPGPVTSFRVIFAYESSAPLPTAQSAVLFGRRVEEYLRTNTTPEGGLAGFRRYDKDTDAANDQPTMAALWAAVKPKLTTIPAMIIERNGKADILPFPTSQDDCLATLMKYRGK